MEHEMQHPDPPTWCIHCGKFDCYCRDDDECRGADRRFDATTDEGRKEIERIIGS